MTQAAEAETEFTAMLRLEQLLQGLELADGSKLRYVSTGKNEPDSGEFLAGYFVADRFDTEHFDPTCNSSVTRVQVIAFAHGQRRAFELAVKARQTLESGPFERVGNASLITRDKLIGVTRDYLYHW